MLELEINFLRNRNEMEGINIFPLFMALINLINIIIFRIDGGNIKTFPMLDSIKLKPKLNIYISQLVLNRKKSTAL